MEIGKINQLTGAAKAIALADDGNTIGVPCSQPVRVPFAPTIMVNNQTRIDALESEIAALKTKYAADMAHIELQIGALADRIGACEAFDVQARQRFAVGSMGGIL